MTVRRVFVTTSIDTPPSSGTIDKARLTACPEILSGIPPNLLDVIPANHLGAFDIEIPDPVPPEPDPIDVLTAQVADLTQQIADMKGSDS